MSDIKPIIEESLILDLLNKSFDQPIEQLESIQGGHMAQVFSFRSGSDDLVIRFTKENLGSFQKEKFIYDNFATPTLPIPPIIKLGEIGNLYYAISKKMTGRELTALSKDEYMQTLPSNMQTLLAIHQSDVGRFTGYSWIGDDGNGMAQSWEEALTSVIKENPDDFYGRWHTLFDTTFLDRKYFETVYQHMVSLIPFCSADRYLIHRDYEYNNVLAENGKVTAVLDWEQASYGDFVYDIAYLNFWRTELDLASPFHDFYAQHGMDLSHFEKRIACYTLYNGLDGLRFFAKAGNPEAGQTVQKIIEPYLAM